MNDPLSGLTHVLEHAKDLTVARLADPPTLLKPPEVIRLLNSANEREVLKGLRTITAYMSTNNDASQFFAHVIKKVSASDLRVRRLVYAYILRYSHSNPDLVLLCVNSIQKSLGESDPEARALALRTIASVATATLLPLCLVAVTSASSDSADVVRFACCHAVVHVHRIAIEENDRASSRTIEENLVGKLLDDRSAVVRGAALVAFNHVCPLKLALLHKRYRSLCATIAEMDEWSQPVAVDVLIRYCRRFINRPQVRDLATGDEYYDMPRNESQLDMLPVYDVKLDVDLELFVTSLRPLTYSSNEAVVAAVTKAFVFLVPAKTCKDYCIDSMLLRQINSLSTSQAILRLQLVLFVVLKKDPKLFQNHYKSFFLLPNDSRAVASLKLQILSLVINENNIRSIVRELQWHVTAAVDDAIAAEVVKTMGKCAQINNYWNRKVLKWLFTLVKNNRAVRVTSSCLEVIRHLIQQSPENNVKSVIRLAQIVTDSEFALSAEAKSSVIWLVGEFVSIIPKFLPDFIKQLVKSFAVQETLVRSNILLIVAKYCVYDMIQHQQKKSESTLSLYRQSAPYSAALFDHTVNLCKYDNSYDIRDQARLFAQLLSDDRTELASLILQAPKPIPSILLTNKPILDNFASPKLDLNPEIPRANDVEISPQPSNKNSFSEKPSVTAPDAITDCLAKTGDISFSDFRTLLIPGIILYMQTEPWASSSNLPSSQIRDPAPKPEKTAKSYSSASFVSSKFKKNTNYSVSNDNSDDAFNGVGKAKSTYKHQSLDEFLSSGDGRREMLARNRRYLKGSGGMRGKKLVVEEEESEEDTEEESEEDEEEEDSDDDNDDDDDDEESEESEEDSEEESEEENEAAHLVSQ